MKIWVDLANAPHVEFFLPVIRKLRAAGHEVLVTLRDFNKTVEIAAVHGLSGTVIGKHGGRNDLVKLLNLAVRSVQLVRVARSWKPEVCVSHNSYTHTVAGRMLGCHVITLMDYEGQPANHIAFRLANRIIVPDCFPEKALRRFGAAESRVVRYSGFKEQLYLSDYRPGGGFSAALRQSCGLPESWDMHRNVLVTVRTPASFAAYHHFSNELFVKLLGNLNRRTDLTVVVLPRDREQLERIHEHYPNLKIPATPLIGADLVYHSDVIISAGGTMNREAAILGTPVYTIFAGELPAVDRRLVGLGRMHEIRNEEDFSRIRFAKNSGRIPLRNPMLCDEIVRAIVSSVRVRRADISQAGAVKRRSYLDPTANLFKVYYLLKRLIPRRCQIDARRAVAAFKRRAFACRWPIDAAAGRRPNGFPGWPEGKRFVLVLRHDVEGKNGLARVPDLVRLEHDLGVKSAFYFVPGGYAVSCDLLRSLRASGNEIGVHGWKHDGSLYLSRSIFLNQARKINRILELWESVGFASPSAHHHFGWLEDLRIEYDTSSFDTDPFEPQPDGVRTIFPLFITRSRNCYVELPYTLAQDFTLYVILREKSARVWKDKLDWIAEKGGMALLNTHPDYMSFDGRASGAEEYPVERYTEFLRYVLSKYQGAYWLALPCEVASYWRRAFAGKCMLGGLPQPNEGSW